MTLLIQNQNVRYQTGLKPLPFPENGNLRTINHKILLMQTNRLQLEEFAYSLNDKLFLHISEAC